MVISGGWLIPFPGFGAHDPAPSAPRTTGECPDPVEPACFKSFDQVVEPGGVRSDEHERAVWGNNAGDLDDGLFALVRGGDLPEDIDSNDGVESAVGFAV